MDGPCRSGPCPRKRLMQGTASTGTIALAAMGRSYKFTTQKCLCRRGP
jgi:hypothetical protein